MTSETLISSLHLCRECSQLKRHRLLDIFRQNTLHLCWQIYMYLEDVSPQIVRTAQNKFHRRFEEREINIKLSHWCFMNLLKQLEYAILMKEIKRKNSSKEVSNFFQNKVFYWNCWKLWLSSNILCTFFAHFLHTLCPCFAFFVQPGINFIRVLKKGENFFLSAWRKVNTFNDFQNTNNILTLMFHELVETVSSEKNFEKKFFKRSLTFLSEQTFLLKSKKKNS